MSNELYETSCKICEKNMDIRFDDCYYNYLHEIICFNCFKKLVKELELII